MNQPQLRISTNWWGLLLITPIRNGVGQIFKGLASPEFVMVTYWISQIPNLSDEIDSVVSKIDETSLELKKTLSESSEDE